MNEILTAGLDCTVRHWNIESGNQLFCIEAHQDKIKKGLGIIDRSKFISAGHDKYLKIFNIENKKCEK